MTADRMARVIASSIAEHQTRGLVDDAAGMADVVIHGRVNLLAVADDVLAASAGLLGPARKSWGGWFACGVEGRRDALRRQRRRDELVDRLADRLANRLEDRSAADLTPVEKAFARLRLRDLDF